MADQQPFEGSSSTEVSGGSTESTVELNIKTLDSRTYSFPVDKNIGILAFKEKIASQSGIPVAQQRLIFRGKVLKDDHLLSEYNVENGDTLHLIERQPQPSPGSGTGEAMPNNVSRGHDSTVSGSRNRIGQIAHSVVLGSLNVGDSGETIVPDLSRVIGAVLNSIGIGNLGGGIQPGVQPSHGHETEVSGANVGIQSQGGNQSVSRQSLNGQSNAVQIPLGAVIAVPTLNMPIPDALNTLAEYMNRMGLVLSQSGEQCNLSPGGTSDLPTIELPTNSRGVPTVEALSVVLRHAQRLLSDHVVSALSRAAGRLEQEGASADPTVRGQVQTESMRLGVAMQHLGALLLELGRTILTLRMGQSPAESFVNAGPAVYISPSGPNPIMVQPFPHQTSSLFGGSASVSSNPIASGPVGVGNAPRNVNIHIHTGASLVPMVSTDNGEGRQVEHSSGTDSGQTRLLSGLSVTATAVPYRPPVVSVSGPIQPGAGTSQPPDSNSISSAVADINAQIRSLVANMQNENHASSVGMSGQGQQPLGSSARDDDRNNLLLNLASNRGDESSQISPHGVDDQKAQPECHHPPNIMDMGAGLNSNDEPSTSADKCISNLSGTSEHAENDVGPTRSNSGYINHDSSSGAPLGLGLGGLQHKKRQRQRGQAKNMDGAMASNQNQQSRAVGQQVLQSLASLSARRNESASPSERLPDLASGATGNRPTERGNANGPIDVTSTLSQVLQSPALDGLLAGVSQQTGIGSPDMMRNMLQQLTQNPTMRNTMNQIAQQIDSHDLGSMFGDSGRGQGGGIDLARMMQQMMPIVSQALGGASSAAQPDPTREPFLSENRSTRDMTPCHGDDPQIDLLPVVQRIETQGSSEEIFRSLANMAAELSGDAASAGERIVNDMCSQEGLVQEFIEMLRHDISRKLEDDMGS